jgi:arginine repressor
MAKKSAAPEGSKTEAVLQYVATNPNATAKEIVSNLKRAGMQISLSLVAKLKSKAAKKSGPSKASTTHPSANGSAETSKAERIRQVAQSMTKPVRPRDVIATLAAEGVQVSSAQVSTTLRAMGMRRRHRGRKPTGAGPSRPSSSTSDLLSLDSLLAAKKLVTQLGSVAAAKSAVDALAKLR